MSTQFIIWYEEEHQLVQRKKTRFFCKDLSKDHSKIHLSLLSEHQEGYNILALHL